MVSVCGTNCISIILTVDFLCWKLFRRVSELERKLLRISFPRLFLRGRRFQFNAFSLTGVSFFQIRHEIGPLLFTFLSVLWQLLFQLWKRGVSIKLSFWRLIETCHKVKFFVGFGQTFHGHFRHFLSFTFVFLPASFLFPLGLIEETSVLLDDSVVH